MKTHDCIISNDLDFYNMANTHVLVYGRSKHKADLLHFLTAFKQCINIRESNSYISRSSSYMTIRNLRKDCDNLCYNHLSKHRPKQNYNLRAYKHQLSSNTKYGSPQKRALLTKLNK